MPRAEIVCIGSELLAGKTNTHVSYLAPKLRNAGLDVLREVTVSDEEGLISRAVCDALARADVVLICGGLGPTFDDLTREAAADALNRRLVYRPALFTAIKKKFARYRIKVPVNNKRQAWIIEGAKILDNQRGSAPGQWIEESGKHLFLLPGPFHELRAIFESHILPGLEKRYGSNRVITQRVFRFCGLTEAEADRMLDPIIRRAGGGRTYTILAGLGFVELHASIAGKTGRETARQILTLDRRVRRLMKKYLYGTDADSLESVIGGRLRRRKWKLGIAESCTGGLLAQRMTAVSGSSRYFAGGIIAYHNDIKSRLLGVSERTLIREGAVSAACARDMAEGARNTLATEIAVSITGIAGPAGGSRENPVGTTYIGIAHARGKTRAFRFVFDGDRRQIRDRAAQTALILLWRLLS